MKFGKALTKEEQKSVTGGFWGCQAQLIPQPNEQ